MHRYHTVLGRTSSVALWVLTTCSATFFNSASTAAPAKITYGSDNKAGTTFTTDGVTLYYETYGEGEPLLIIHGNDANIGAMWKQIDHFKKKYKVIAMDSREQGKSGASDAPLTYEKMADDLAALLDHLKLESVNVLGWSDGAINGMLLAMRHPQKVKKLAAMAPNLDPKGFHPEADVFLKQHVNSITDAERATPEGKRKYKVAAIGLSQPNIEPSQLKKLAAPTLILAGDHDIVSSQHIVAMFEALPNAQLAVFPNATHMVPYDDPVAFNATVERFLSAPFVKRERIGDSLKTFEKMERELGVK